MHLVIPRVGQSISTDGRSVSRHWRISPDLMTIDEWWQSRRKDGISTDGSVFSSISVIVTNRVKYRRTSQSVTDRHPFYWHLTETCPTCLVCLFGEVVERNTLPKYVWKWVLLFSIGSQWGRWWLAVIGSDVMMMDWRSDWRTDWRTGEIYQWKRWQKYGWNNIMDWQTGLMVWRTIKYPPPVILQEGQVSSVRNKCVPYNFTLPCGRSHSCPHNAIWVSQQFHAGAHINVGVPTIPCGYPHCETWVSP